MDISRMNTGIITVAFGAEYDKCAAACMRVSRQHTDLPFCIVTNLVKRSAAWESVSGVSFHVLQMPQQWNRRAKLRLNELTPFTKTLYIDADSLVQRPGVEIFADLLDAHDMAFNQLMYIDKGQRFVNIYIRCMKMFGVEKPLRICNGGIIAFRRSPAVDSFFKQWYAMWEAFGSGREMPPLNCCIKKTGIDYALFPKGYFAPDSENSAAIVQHNYNANFCAKFGIPHWREYKPFDATAKDDWRLEP